MFYNNTDNNFYVFRSEIQHKIKNNKYQFILDIINSDIITLFYKQADYVKCLYLLSCIDTLCMEENIPICSDYDKYRQLKLKMPLYIGKDIKDDNYLPIFKAHNIYEVTLYDAC